MSNRFGHFRADDAGPPDPPEGPYCSGCNALMDHDDGTFRAVGWYCPKCDDYVPPEPPDCGPPADYYRENPD